MKYKSQKSPLIFLNNLEKILIVGNQNASGDCISSILALQIILTKAQKKVSAIVPYNIPDNYKFLVGTKKLKHSLTQENDLIISISTEKLEIENISYAKNDKSVDILIKPKSGNISNDKISFQKNSENFDAIVVLDSDSLEDVGKIFEQNTVLFSKTPIVNISCSADNEFFGKINYIQPTANSICEILFDCVEKDENFIKFLDVDLATILLTGIISKTESFLNYSTTANSFEAASKLQKLGAKQSDIIEHLFKMKSLPTLKIWGRILGNLEVDNNHQISWSYLTKSDFRIAEAQKNHIDSFIDDLLRHIKNIDFSILFIEEGSDTLVQIRTANPTINFEKLSILLEKQNIVPIFTKNGVNFSIKNKTAHEVEKNILKLITDFQKERLNLPFDLPIKKVDLLKEKTKIEKSQNIEKKEVVSSLPKAPEIIPFDAPFQPHEKSQ